VSNKRCVLITWVAIVNLESWLWLARNDSVKAVIGSNVLTEEKDWWMKGGAPSNVRPRDMWCMCVRVDSEAVLITAYITPLLSGCFEGVDAQLLVVCVMSDDFSRQCSCETNSGRADQEERPTVAPLFFRPPSSYYVLTRRLESTVRQHNWLLIGNPKCKVSPFFDRPRRPLGWVEV